MSEETFVNVCCDCVDLFIDSCIELKTAGEHQLQEGSIMETGKRILVDASFVGK